MLHSLNFNRSLGCLCHSRLSRVQSAINYIYKFYISIFFITVQFGWSRKPCGVHTYRAMQLLYSNSLILLIAGNPKLCPRAWGSYATLRLSSLEYGEINLKIICPITEPPPTHPTHTVTVPYCRLGIHPCV